MAWRIARQVAFLAAAVLVLAGCGPTIEQPVTSLSEVGSDSVVVVGRLELDPPLRPGEQQIRAGTIDPLGVGDQMRDHGMLWFGHSAQTPTEKGEIVHSPRLGELYFLALPKSTSYLLGGYIRVQFVTRMVSPRTVAVDEARIEIPGGLRYDIRPGDKAIYVGTLRLHRDEFNEVVKADIIDDYETAAAEFKKRFGPGTTLRKAVPRRRTDRAAAR